MVRVDRIAFEKPPLHRSEGDVALETPLLGAGARIRAGHRRQRRDRLVLEELSERELESRVPGPSHDLDAENGITAQLEEVVVDPDPSTR